MSYLSSCWKSASISRSRHEDDHTQHLFNYANKSKKKTSRLELDRYSDHNNFQCGTCGKWFKQRSNLKVHHRIHLKLRPFVCDLCGRSFSQKGNMQTHLRVHHSKSAEAQLTEFVCQQCGVHFMSRTALSDHVKAFHTEPRLATVTCHVGDCMEGFPDEETMKVHFEEVHIHNLQPPGIDFRDNCLGAKGKHIEKSRPQTQQTSHSNIKLEQHSQVESPPKVQLINGLTSSLAKSHSPKPATPELFQSIGLQDSPKPDSPELFQSIGLQDSPKPDSPEVFQGIGPPDSLKSNISPKIEHVCPSNFLKRTTSPKTIQSLCPPDSPKSNISKQVMKFARLDDLDLSELMDICTKRD
eukprot:92750_1